MIISAISSSFLCFLVSLRVSINLLKISPLLYIIKVPLQRIFISDTSQPRLDQHQRTQHYNQQQKHYHDKQKIRTLFVRFYHDINQTIYRRYKQHNTHNNCHHNTKHRKYHTKHQSIPLHILIQLINQFLHEHDQLLLFILLHLTQLIICFLIQTQTFILIFHLSCPSHAFNSLIIISNHLRYKLLH